MTRKHFRMIAKIIAEENVGEGRETCREIALAFARELPQYNDNFNREKFLTAALGDDYVEGS